ncbi:MAG: hypothetical protein H0T42_08385 [Deltaproteobacteria bacterium]|nr:hypothetical protein [Deltaproteobacteria bacterium]
MIALLGTGCVIPFVTPPLRAEVGATTQAGGQDSAPPSIHVAAGAHLASALRRRDQPFDLGIGWVFEGNNQSSGNGGYVEAAYFVDRGVRTRTAAGVRSEILWTSMGRVVANKLRIDHELFTTGRGEFKTKERCGGATGLYSGATAIGVFVEAGHAWRPGDGFAFVATAGVSLRLPGTVGVMVGIPFCN